MHNHASVFIQDIAIIMIVAGFTTILCRRFNQPVVLGYLLAGIVIGPYTPPFSFITDQGIIKTLAELGVIFLMFSLGLEFNLQKLSKVGSTALIAATLEIILMLWVGYELGLLFGWSQINAIFLGAILSISSTTIIIKALDELKLKNESFSHIIFGILIVEDIYAIIILALLSSLAVTGSLGFGHVLVTSTKLLAFLAVVLLLGILLIPRLLSYVASFKSDEVLLITALGLCFGFCLLVIKLEYSVALGAFVIGAVMAESSEQVKIEKITHSIKDMFSAIFFVTIGLLFDPSVITNYLGEVLLITLAVMLGKVVSCGFGVLMAGHDGRTSMRAGMGLAQIGEFSFIIAALGISLGVTSKFLYSITVCVSIITTLTTPYFIKYSDRVAAMLVKCMPGSVTRTFRLYTEWVNSINPNSNQLKLKSIIEKSIKQVIINFLIMVAIFSAGIFLANSAIGDIIVDISNDHIQHSIIWAGCLILSLPFMIASYQKVKGLSMILAEFQIQQAEKSRFPKQIRLLISQLIPIVYLLFVIFLVSALSLNILPAIEMMFLILVFAGLISFFLLPWFTKMHTKLQIAVKGSMRNK